MDCRVCCKNTHICLYDYFYDIIAELPEMTKVRFHNPDFKPDTVLNYSVTVARFEDKK
jgi:hypothetical protein